VAGELAFGRRGQAAMRWVFVAAVVFCIAAAICGVVVSAAGRRDLTVSLWGPLAISLMGITFGSGALANVFEVGFVEVVFVGRVSKVDRPLLYWAVLIIPLILGIGLLSVGLWLLARGA